MCIYFLKTSAFFGSMLQTKTNLFTFICKFKILVTALWTQFFFYFCSIHWLKNFISYTFSVELSRFIKLPQVIATLSYLHTFLHGLCNGRTFERSIYRLLFIVCDLKTAFLLLIMLIYHHRKPFFYNLFEFLWKNKFYVYHLLCFFKNYFDKYL